MHMELVRKQENNENIVDIYIVIQIISIIVDFFIIFGLLIVKICVSFLFWKKNDKVLTLDVVRFPNFEISASLHLSPPSNKRHTSQFQNLISAGVGY